MFKANCTEQFHALATLSPVETNGNGVSELKFSRPHSKEFFPPDIRIMFPFMDKPQPMCLHKDDHPMGLLSH